jgi:cyclohexanone monooxygenase
VPRPEARQAAQPDKPANIAGKPRAFLPYLGPEGVGGYRRKSEEIAAKNYEGFALS